MTIELYVNNSEENRADKDLTLVSTLTGELRDQASIIDPDIMICADPTDLASVNYAKIPDFGRSYFIRNITSVRKGLCRVSMHVDALSSWKTQIRGCTAIITRQESLWNLYLNDGSLRAYQDPDVYTVPFSGGFVGSSFVLAVAGG